jgi:membrane fusion protein
VQLFRPEALRGQDRLHGDVVLVPPVSWQLLGAFQLAAVIAAAAFLASASYAKVTIVPGRLVTAAEARTVTAIELRGGRLQARLAVPPAAAGFIEPGQTVRIAVDAFPFATHGTIEGRIDSVSSAAVPLAGSADEVFVAMATLRQDSIRAFGRARPLRPGMTVSARITTRSRSLVELLFEPFYAAAP